MKQPIERCCGIDVSQTADNGFQKWPVSYDIFLEDNVADTKDGFCLRLIRHEVYLSRSQGLSPKLYHRDLLILGDHNYNYNYIPFNDYIQFL